MVDEPNFAEESSRRILVGLSKHLEDPKVLSALLLSVIVYQRADDVNSMLNKLIVYIREKQGMSAEDTALSIFQAAVALLGRGASGYTLSKGASELTTKAEIDRLKQKFATEMIIYNEEKALWDERQAVPKPEFPPIISFEEFVGSTVGFTDEQYIFAEKAYSNYVKEQEAARVVYRRKIDWWNKIQVMPEPTLPVKDPAIALWEKHVEVSAADAATFALAAFIIGLNPSLVPETLKGIGEILKGFGEIVPL